MNYYNEFDAKAAAWLAELIKQKVIPNGKIDSRSIRDVQPADLDGFAQCHFFAGIGGWPYALQLAGWTSDRPVWTGSCPCQPFSVAGQGKGTADERHLWPEFFRLIRERQPAIVFGEQVASAAGRDWLAGVRADLEGVGYAVGAADLCAAGAGAPHIRQRLYWVGNAADARLSHPENAGANCKNAGEGIRREKPERTGAPCRVVQPIQPRLEGQSGHGDNGNEPGRFAPAENRSTPAPGTTGAWSDFDLVHCRDGKSRRIPTQFEPSILLLADGFWYAMANVRAEFSAQAINQIKTYDKNNDSDPKETLLMVQKSIRAQAIQWPVGGSWQFSPQEVLFPFLRDALSTLNGSSIKECGEEKGAEINEGVLRDLRNVVESECASYRRESIEQFGDEPSGSLSRLSWFLARCGQACGYSTSRENAATFPLANKMKGRVGLLRGYGNAIVPQIAAIFIKSFLESYASTPP